MMGFFSSGTDLKTPRRIMSPVILAKKRSTWFSHELCVGIGEGLKKHQKDRRDQ